MVPRLDIGTLQASSILVSLTFAAVFLGSWWRHRGEIYLAWWAASLLLYVTAIAAFALLPHRLPPVLIALLMAIISGSNIPLVAGVRLFDGERPFRAWMAAPPLVTALGMALPHVAGAPMLGHVAGTLGLVCGMAAYGSALARRSNASARVVGWALLAYIPGYGLALADELFRSAPDQTVATIALLLDQVLLLVLNIALLAMPGARAIARLRESALTDPLTGLRNRAWLAEQGGAIAAAGAAVVLIDVDHFKAINDQNGHAAGDAVLASFAVALDRLALPLGGAVVRLGGDEFVAVLPSIRRPAALTFAEAVRALPAARPSGVPLWTISLGLAFTGAGETSLAPALARADASLYRAKASGRNRVAA